MAAVRQDAVHVDIFDIRGAVPDGVQALLRLEIALRSLPLRQVVVHPLGVDGAGYQAGGAHAQARMLLNGGPVIQYGADCRRRHRYQDHNCGDQ